MSKQLPLVSIIVPARNISSIYPECIKSIRNQTYSNIEIIIVALGLERSIQRNIGIERAKGTYIYITGSDLFLESKAIEQAVEICKSKDFAVINIAFPEPTNILQKVRRIDREVANSDTFHIAGNFFPKSILRANPYNNELHGGEEIEIHLRLIAKGYTFGVTEQHNIHLGEPSTVKESLMHYYYYGSSIARYMKELDKYHAKIKLIPIRLKHLHRKYIIQFGLSFFYFLVYQFCVYTIISIGVLKNVSINNKHNHTNV